MPRAGKKTTGTRFFVLDTNVLLHDPTALFRFKEHDLFIPMMVVRAVRWLDSPRRVRLSRRVRTWWTG